jgi:hypothetical protein
MMAAWGRQMTSQLRMLAPQPFGLVNDRLRFPAFVGSLSQRASVQHLPGISRDKAQAPPVSSMTLCYGIPEDLLSPYVEVFTDFTADQADSVSLRSALGKALSGHQARMAGERQPNRRVRIEEITSRACQLNLEGSAEGRLVG